VLLALLVLQAAAVGTVAAAPAPAASTLQSDVEALLDFWTKGVEGSEGSAILQDWQGRADPDPCTGAWAGVICDCGGLPAALQAACAVSAAANASGNSTLRIVGLDVGPLVAGSGAKLRGTINPSLGSLSQLAYLDLSDNELT
jgi:hypothetical protein